MAPCGDVAAFLAPRSPGTLLSFPEAQPLLQDLLLNAVAQEDKGVAQLNLSLDKFHLSGAGRLTLRDTGLGPGVHVVGHRDGPKPLHLGTVCLGRFGCVEAK
jgi:hypothetical protein